jgi:hypothetical protein
MRQKSTTKASNNLNFSMPVGPLVLSWCLVIHIGRVAMAELCHLVTVRGEKSVARDKR